MNEQEQAKIRDEIARTIRVNTGIMSLPPKLIDDFMDAVGDLPAAGLSAVLTDWRKNKKAWLQPALLREAVIGTPDIDEFNRYMDLFIPRGRAGEYEHTIGSQVIGKMGGRRIFTESNMKDRPALLSRWRKIWREVEADERESV